MNRLNLSLLVLIVLAFAASLLAGRVWLPPASLLAPHDSLAGLIIYDVRLPRTVLALIVGAVLGLSGAVLQGFTRNPLAEPALLGVSSGAALGAVIAIYFGLAALSPVTGPLMGMAGALAACALTFALGQGSNRGGTVALVLAGAAVSSLTAAGIALALNFAPSPYAAYEIMSWLLGSLADKSWTQVWLVLPFALVGAALLAVTGRALDALSLGEAQAQSLGVHLTRLAALVVGGTALSVGAITSVTGAIGFIGLVAPHLVRPFVGYAPRRVLLPATLAGALLLLCADIAARLVHTNPELRLGVFTSLLGTPFFFWLVVRIRKVAP
ncbi:MAG TPA: iron ABC transporter permease [Rhizomicrobium sp.]|jgi:iron complex transport system permease protein|nr:iron ABC transporter permease [Rhizomicrobium sp.]